MHRSNGTSLGAPFPLRGQEEWLDERCGERENERERGAVGKAEVAVSVNEKERKI